MKKISISVLLLAMLLIALLFAPVLSHAQSGLPGNGADPYAGSPAKVDSWILAVGFAALICLIYFSAKK